MTATEIRRNRDRAILRVLWNRPLTVSELAVTLHGLDELPVSWTSANLRSVLRRLQRDGLVSRLEAPGVTRSVLWWAH